MQNEAPATPTANFGSSGGPIERFSQLSYPIMQAPIGSASSVKLALAVANGGAMGSLALTWASPEDVTQALHAMNAGTSGLFAVNYLLTREPQTLDLALELGVPAVTFSYGVSDAAFRRVVRANALLGVQVSSLEGARKAEAMGADFLICQGVEAGGHVQSSTPLERLLREVREHSKLPLVAAGGLATRDDVEQVRELGADIAALGTRFVVAQESNAHSSYQQAIVAAKAADTALTCCFDGGWEYSTSRVLRNSTLQRWEAAGSPARGARPGESDVVATTQTGWEIPRYHIASPAEGTTGELEQLAMYAGAGVGNIDSVATVAEILESLAPTKGKA